MRATDTTLSLHKQEPALAYAYALADQYDDALKIYQAIQSQQPHNFDLLCNIGFVCKKLNRIEEAIESYQLALVLDPNNAKALRGISHAYLALGNFNQGWPAYEYRWVNPPAYTMHLKHYLQTHRNLENKRIVLKSEYGLGDTLQFIRYAKVLKEMGAYIIVESQPALVELLSCCPYIDQIIASGQPLPSIDLQALLMSLPYILDTTENTIPAEIPYMYADPQLITQWQNRCAADKKFKIGLCWQADPHTNSDNTIVQKDAHAKSIPLEILAPLAQITKVSFYSLQKISGEEQLEQIPEEFVIHTFGPDFDHTHGRFMDTAAVMCSMDLIITVDTSIAHLAGALGKPVWVMLPYAADWRWMLNRDDSPWYPTMRLFRQTKSGDWQSVINNIMHALPAMFDVT